VAIYSPTSQLTLSRLLLHRAKTSRACLLDCKASGFADSAIAAIGVMLDKAAASPVLLTPGAAKIIMDMLTSDSPPLYADADAAIVASAAKKLSQNLVANHATTSQGFDTTMGYLASLCVIAPSPSHLARGPKLSSCSGSALEHSSHGIAYWDMVDSKRS